MKRRYFSLFMVMCLIFAYISVPDHQVWAAAPSSQTPQTAILDHSFATPSSSGTTPASGPAIVLSSTNVTVEGCHGVRNTTPFSLVYFTGNSADGSSQSQEFRVRFQTAFVTVNMTCEELPGNLEDYYSFEIISNPGNSNDVRLVSGSAIEIWRSIRPGTVSIKATPVRGSGLNEQILSINVEREPEKLIYVVTRGIVRYTDDILFFQASCKNQYGEMPTGWPGPVGTSSGSAISITDSSGRILGESDGVRVDYSDPIIAIHFDRTIPSGAYTFNDTRCYAYQQIINCPDVTNENVINIYGPDRYRAVLINPLNSSESLLVSGGAVTTELPFSCFLVENSAPAVPIVSATEVSWRIKDENGAVVQDDEARIDPDTGYLTVFPKLRDRCSFNTTTLSITCLESFCSATTTVNIRFPYNSGTQVSPSPTQGEDPSTTPGVTEGEGEGSVTDTPTPSPEAGEDSSSTPTPGGTEGQSQTTPTPAAPGGTVNDPNSGTGSDSASGSSSSEAGSTGSGAASGTSGDSGTPGSGSDSTPGSGSPSTENSGTSGTGSSGSGSSAGAGITNTPTPAPSARTYVPTIYYPASTTTPAPSKEAEKEPSATPAPEEGSKEIINPDGSVTITTVTQNPDNTVTVTTVRKYPNGSSSTRSVTLDQDENILSTTTASVSFTGNGTKLEESKTSNSDGSSLVRLDKTTKKGNFFSESTDTNAEGVVTIVKKTKKTDGSDITRTFLQKAEGKVKLTCYDTNVTTAEIPSSITANGKSYSVTMIGNNAMNNNDVIETVKIGKNITSIGRNAFKGNDNLSSIIIYSSKIKDIGIYAIKAVAPDAVVKIKADKSSYKSIRKMIKSSGADRTLSYKRLKVSSK